MRILKIICLSLVLSLSTGCYAQYAPVKVEISGETVKIRGELYYLHRVEKRQTIYSIAKRYGTDAETLTKDNPSIAAGLKEGQVLYIKAGNIPEEEPEEKIPVQIVIPESKSETIAKLDGEYQAEHTVRWFESLSAIARRYNVTEQEIALFNSLKDNKIETRQRLFIPYPGTVDTSVAIVEEEVLPDKTIYPPTYTEKEPDAKREEIIRPRSVTTSLILPLTGVSDTTSSERRGFIEFYQGFLMALEEIKNDNPGISINLNVIDSDIYPTSEQLIRSSLYNNSNLIIGPVFGNQIEPVLQFAQLNNSYVISPVDPESEKFAKDYANFFQVSTPVWYQQRGILTTLNVFTEVALVFEEGTNNSALVSTTREILDANGIRYNTLSYNILRGRAILPEITALLHQDKVNHVIVASDSEAFVFDVLRNLNLLHSRNNFKINVYGTPRWRDFESVDIEYYHQMNLSISMQYHIDYNRENIREFVSKFRAMYKSEPSPYAFQGYDVASYFLAQYLNYGDHFLKNAHLYRRELLQSDYNFVRRDGEKGFVNSAIRRVIFRPDYSTVNYRSFFR